MFLQRLRRLFRRDAQQTESETVATAIADNPIRNASDDLLSRTVLADRIAEIVSSPAPGQGRVIAIRGGWGYGKSSLKNLVIEALEKKSPPTDFLDFNPWQWGDGDTIARALFGQMASRLGGSHSPRAAKRAKALRRYGRILVGSSNALGKAGDDKNLTTWLGSAGLVLAGVGIGTPNLPIKVIAAAALILTGVLVVTGKLFNWLGRDASSEPLDKVREDLEVKLKDLNRPLVVFVDDIDRLDAEQIRLLFRQIKVNANLPNILFVLLFQPSIVENALKPVAGSEGREYLEKIVQAHIDLPPVSPERLFQIFGVQLSRLIGDLATEANGFDQRRWGNVALGGIQPFIRNLRDVRRLLASIEIHLPLHRGSRVFEVNVIDFVALEVLRVFEPHFHAAIAADKTLLLQTQRFDGDRRDEHDRTAIEQLVDLTTDARREACKDMLGELFPQVHWVFGGSHYSGGTWVRTWLNDKRVCTTRSFDRYFLLQLPDGAMSESEFADLLEAAEDFTGLAEAIARLRERGVLSALATRFDESVDQLPLEQVERLVPAMFELGEEFSREPGTVDPFNTPFLAMWRSSSWYLRRVPTATERSRIALDALKTTHALSVPAVLISLDMDARLKPDKEYERLFNDLGLRKLKKAWLSVIEDQANNDPNFLEHDQLLSHLYRWRDLSRSLRKPRAWVERVASDDARLVRLLVRFLNVGLQSTWGDKVSVKSESYRYETMSDFFDLDVLRRRVSRIDRGSLDAEEVRILGILDRHLRLWEKGERSDD